MFSKLKSNTTLCFAESSPASISASQGLPGRKEPIPLCVAWPWPHGIKKRTVEILQELNLNLHRKEPIYVCITPVAGVGQSPTSMHVFIDLVILILQLGQRYLVSV